MLVAPARRCRLITRFRSEAMTCGAAPVRTVERSSAKVTSRTRVQRVLDLPVPADPAGELFGTGLVRAQVGDRVDGLGAPSSVSVRARAHGSCLAGELRGLAGVRELDPHGDGDDLERADLSASVRGLEVSAVR